MPIHTYDHDLFWVVNPDRVRECPGFIPVQAVKNPEKVHPNTVGYYNSLVFWSPDKVAGEKIADPHLVEYNNDLREEIEDLRAEVMQLTNKLEQEMTRTWR